MRKLIMVIGLFCISGISNTVFSGQVSSGEEFFGADILSVGQDVKTLSQESVDGSLKLSLNHSHKSVKALLPNKQQPLVSVGHNDRVVNFSRSKVCAAPR